MNNNSLIGKIIDGYEVLEEVGHGGMATVYRAHQLSMDRDVAIKMLPPQFLNQTTSLERFKQEASIVARLQHRAIVPVHDYGEYEGIPYIVMRLMDAGSVEEWLAAGPIPPAQTLAILEQIAPALDYAHREGVLHRDLKPGNILLDANGDAYITDFGIARIVNSDSKPLTTSGVVGTPSYMSPEQAQGKAMDGRSDVYALGVVLFEMLTGVRPFEGDTPYIVAVKHVTEPPPSARNLNANLPTATEKVLYKALAKTCDLRYQSASELAAALREALEQPDIPLQEEVETEPALHEKLRAGAARRGLDPAQAVPPPRLPPNLQRVPAYQPSGSHLYSGLVRASQPRRAQRSTARGSSWITWATVGLVIGGLALAAAIGGVYFWLNSDNNTTDGDGAIPGGYNETAIFKLTATRQAIEQSLGTPSAAPMSSVTVPSALPTPTPTAPFTNTPRVPIPEAFP